MGSHLKPDCEVTDILREWPALKAVRPLCIKHKILYVLLKNSLIIHEENTKEKNV
jgi:hypothetical protein